MNKIFSIYLNKIIGILVFVVFAFSFLHSELGFLNFDGDNHGAHDYCQIVKNSTTHTIKTVTYQAIKAQVEKAICFHCFEEITSQENISFFIKNKECFSPKQSSEIYLHNNTFLI